MSVFDYVNITTKRSILGKAMGGYFVPSSFAPHIHPETPWWRRLLLWLQEG